MPLLQNEEALVDDVDITVGVIAATAALAGVALTQLGEFFRRRWEDRRRWSDFRRIACREFMYSSRVLYSLVNSHKRNTLELRALGEAHELLSAEVAAGAAGSRAPARVQSNLAEAKRIREQQERLRPKIDPTFERLNEAAADVVILCSERLRELAAAHQELIMAIHGQRLDGLTKELGERFLEEMGIKVADSAEALRLEMRKELGIRAGG